VMHASFPTCSRLASPTPPFPRRCPSLFRMRRFSAWPAACNASKHPEVRGTSGEDYDLSPRRSSVPPCGYSLLPRVRDFPARCPYARHRHRGRNRGTLDARDKPTQGRLISCLPTLARDKPRRSLGAAHSPSGQERPAPGATLPEVKRNPRAALLSSK